MLSEREQAEFDRLAQLAGLPSHEEMTRQLGNSPRRIEGALTAILMAAAVLAGGIGFVITRSYALPLLAVIIMLAGMLLIVAVSNLVRRPRK